MEFSKYIKKEIFKEHAGAFMTWNFGMKTCGTLK